MYRTPSILALIHARSDFAGQLKLPKPFWSTTEVQHSGSAGVKTFALPEADGPFNFVNSCGLRYEAEEVNVIPSCLLD